MIARIWRGVVRTDDADEYATAGDDHEAAVLYPEDERYLIETDLKVRHYEVIDRVDPD